MTTEVVMQQTRAGLSPRGRQRPYFRARGS